MNNVRFSRSVSEGFSDPGQSASYRLAAAGSAEVIDSLPLGIVFQSREGKIITANPAAQKILGLSLDQMRGVTSTDARWRAIREDGTPFPGEDHPAMVSLRTGLPVKNVQMGVFNPVIVDFTWIDVSAFPATGDTANEPVGVYTVFEDITALKKAERSQEASQVKLESALASMTDAVFISDCEGRCINFNDAFSTVHRFKDNESCARTLAEGLDFLEVHSASGELLPLEQWAVPRALRGETGVGVEVHLRRKDTNETWVGSYSFAPVRDHSGRIIGSIVTGRDITEHRRMDQEAREHASLLKVAGRLARFGGWRMDLADRQVVWSEEVAAIHETPPDFSPSVEEAINFYAPEWRDKIASVVGACARDGTPYDEELQLITARGKRIWVRSVGEAIRNEAGEIFQIQGAIQDITQRTQAEAAVRKSEERMRQLVTLMPDTLFINQDEKVVFINPRGLRLWRAEKPEQILGRSPFELFHPDGHELMRKRINQVLAGTQAPPAEFQIVAFDGTVLPVETMAVELSIAGKKAILVVVRDITERKQAEEALRQKMELQDQLAKIANTVPGIIYSFKLRPDGSTCIPFATPMMEELWGLRLEDIRDDFTMGLARIHADDVDHVRESIAESASNLKPWQDTFRIDHPRKGERWLEGHSMPRCEDGGDILWHGFVHDITERKLAEEELRKTQDTLVQAQKIAHLGSFEFVATTGMTVWSEEEYRIYGLDPARPSPTYDEMLAECIHPEDAALLHESFTKAMQGISNYELEHRIVRPDGSVRWVYDLAHPYFDEHGKLVRYIGTTLDITDRKLTEDRLGAALVAAEAAGRAKSEFLGVMSHELRTPLNGVLGFAELLADTQLNEEQRDYVLSISSSGNHLLGVVRDILDFSSIEAGKSMIVSAPMAVAEVVELSASAVRKTAADKGLAFRCTISRDVPRHVTGDALRIRQILINLLGNAVKFTSSGSVDFQIAPDEEGRFLKFLVQDTGIGIASETVALLFKPFTQVDSSSSRVFGGTGLGLTISQRYAQAMGGSITVASTPGKGSTFTFHFPLESAREVAGEMLPAPRAAPDGTNTKPTNNHPSGNLVLVVEDNPENSKLAGKMLSRLSYGCEFAANGEEAVNAFAPGKYSAILMDMVMPAMNGIDATEKIREIEEAGGGHVPIIALTASVMPGDRERYLAAGMDDFLAKPFRSDELAAKLAGLQS